MMAETKRPHEPTLPMPTAGDTLNRQIVNCAQCPRLREHCSELARVKRRAYQDWEYWGRPVPNFGGLPARLLIIGLAPAAHGANRTGRMFTGDRSGDWLYRALHRAGFASQPQATHGDDGLQLLGCAITAVCHCAPPQNRPTREEIAACQPWLNSTMELARAKVYLALGGLAWRATLEEFRRRGWWTSRLPRFGHAACHRLPSGEWLLGSYHPSQQNTFTGRLTEPMFDAIFDRARELCERDHR